METDKGTMTRFGHCHARSRRQRGSAAVEFGLCAMVLFTFIFGTIEVARAFFLWNTIPMITTRAARAVALADYSQASATTSALKDALAVAAVNDQLVFAPEITHENLIVDFLQWDGVSAVPGPPPSPAQNFVNCSDNPRAMNCIHFIRVRFCQKSSDTCEQVPYEPMVLLPGMDALRVTMPTFSARAALESTGLANAASP